MAIKTPKIWFIAAFFFSLVLVLSSFAGTIQGREPAQTTIGMDEPTPVPDGLTNPPPPDEGAPADVIDWANVTMIDADHPLGETSIIREALPGNSPQPVPPPSSLAPQPAPLPSPDANDTHPAGSPEPGNASQTTYVVQRGDTLHQISLRFGVPQSVLAAANNIWWVDLIYAGQELIIPAGYDDPGATLTAVPPPKEQPSGGVGEPVGESNSDPDTGSTYVVQRGDSLGTISWRFGVDMGAIIAANRLVNPNYIQAGQTLIIPAANSPSPVEEPVVSENVESTPVPQQAKKAPPMSAVANSGSGDTNIYTVAFGDTLSKIAGRFGVALIDLITLNNLINPNYIYQGQELIIPQPGDQIEAVEEPPKEVEEPIEEVNTNSKFIWPLENYSIINYYWAYHPGLDLVVDLGTTVFASAGGKVEFSGWNVNGYGYMVIIDHGGGVKTLYAHNSELLVVEGEKVEQGQPIALSGSTGNSNWPHVHLELIFNERVRENPCQYLPGGCS
ncbi:MAG: M23 family metallopeptidase [Anaerolineae bacterium]|nr:MAG: M23 family metallopeptidase [Anaerolineae bacterium]